MIAFFSDAPRIKPILRKFFFILAETEGARGSQLGSVGAGIQIQLKRLFTDWGGKIDGIGNAVTIAGINADELAGIVDFNGFANAKIFSSATLSLQSHRLERSNVRKRASIEDREFEIVQLDDDVIDAVTDQRGKQMLGGRNQNALTHQAGGITDFGNVAACGGNFKIVEICASE